MGTAIITLTAAQVRIDGHDLAPGVRAGAVIVFTPVTGQSKSSTPNVIGGKIKKQTKTDADGNVRFVESRNALIGAAGPGKITAAIGTPGNDLVHAELEVT